MWLRVRATSVAHDRSGLAAVEFAMIIPIMVVLFFGTDEFSAAVAVDRKVTQVARTLSDLTSQNTRSAMPKLTNFWSSGKGDHDALPVDAGGRARSRNSTSIRHGESAGAVEQGVDDRYARRCLDRGDGASNPGDVVALPTDSRRGKGTYLICSEVRYKYTPSVGMVLASDRHHLERCHLHPSAPGALRDISDGWPLHLSDAVTAAVSDNLHNSQRSPRPSLGGGAALFG